MIRGNRRQPPNLSTSPRPNITARGGPFTAFFCVATMYVMPWSASAPARAHWLQGKGETLKKEESASQPVSNRRTLDCLSSNYCIPSSSLLVDYCVCVCVCVVSYGSIWWCHDRPTDRLPDAPPARPRCRLHCKHDPQPAHAAARESVHAPPFPVVHSSRLASHPARNRHYRPFWPGTLPIPRRLRCLYTRSE